MLPQARFPETSREGATLEYTMDDYDAYILNAFGVLNRGEAPIPGAVARIAQLRAAGKCLVVLTNAASYTRSGVLARYHRLGFDFTLEEVFSSRDVAFAHLPEVHGVWAAITSGDDDLSDVPAGHCVADLHAQPELLNTAAGFLFLSTARWSDADNAHLQRALHVQMRPVVVAIRTWWHHAITACRWSPVGTPKRSPQALAPPCPCSANLFATHSTRHCNGCPKFPRSGAQWSVTSCTPMSSAGQLPASAPS